jgi:hypothetical protein
VPHLPLVPIDEDRINGDQAQSACHRARREQIGFTEPDHRDVQRSANFQEARLLEVADDEGIISCAFGLERVADCLRGAAEFRQRVEEMIGRIETVDFELDAGTGNRVQDTL